ncbi:G5 domain-containing protein [Lachnospiraceae bacterium]|nr:G5 domain-containing protein [Lachnospiraceae bacterium]
MINLKKAYKSMLAILLSACFVITCAPHKVMAEKNTPTDATSTDASETDAELEKKYEGLTIKNNISINGQDVSGLTYQEAMKALGSAGNMDDVNVTLTSEYGDVVATLGEMGLSDNTSDVVEEALRYGNSGNVLHRFKETKLLENTPVDLTVNKTVSSSIISQMVDNGIGSALSGDGGYTISKNGDSISVKAKGETLSPDAKAIEKAIETKINEQGYSGSDITTSIILNNNAEGEREKQLARIKDLLGSYTTEYGSSGASRCVNVERASSLVDGHVLFPGEQISVYNCIAPIELSNGYELAHAFVANEVVDSPGGGVCQVASTIYNAVLRAELEVLQRECHSMPVSYVPLSADATIAGGVLDFKFRNNLDAPIYIEAGWDGGYLTFNIYGEEYRPANRTIEFESVQTGTIAPPSEPVYTEDKNLPPGTESVVSSAVTGYTAELWKHVYVDGVETESVLVNTSKYDASPAKIAVNTDKADSKKKKKKETKKEDEEEEEQEEADEPDEPVTEEKKKKKTEEQTEAPTEAPTEEQTEAPTEAPSEEPAETPPEGGDEE